MATTRKVEAEADGLLGNLIRNAIEPCLGQEAGDGGKDTEQDQSPQHHHPPAWKIEHGFPLYGKSGPVRAQSLAGLVLRLLTSASVDLSALTRTLGASSTST